VNLPTSPLTNFNQADQKTFPVLIVPVYSLSMVTTAYHVVERTGKFNSRSPCHPLTIYFNEKKINNILKFMD
jgi:hypothetical protein